jgi:hypothetical protein
MINKWLKKLELTDWTIELEAIKHEQDSNTKHGIIYYDRPLTEEDIVHELLHVKYNNWSEDQVNTETERLLKSKQR